LLEGERRLLAERVATALCRLAGCPPSEEGLEPEPPPPPEPPRRPPEPMNPLALVESARATMAYRVASLVLEARRSYECCRPLASLSALLALGLRGDDLREAAATAIESAVLRERQPAGRPGLMRLLALSHRYERSRRLHDMIRLAAAAAAEATRPCMVDPALRMKREMLERRMRLYGLALALIIPAAIAATIILDPVALLPAGAAVVAVWWLIRRDGERFQAVNIEVAWSECKLTERELAEIIGGAGAPDLIMAYIVFGSSKQ
jgi:hypothetical protein